MRVLGSVSCSCVYIWILYMMFLNVSLSLAVTLIDSREVMVCNLVGLTVFVSVTNILWKRTFVFISSRCSDWPVRTLKTGHAHFYDVTMQVVLIDGCSAVKVGGVYGQNPLILTGWFWVTLVKIALVCLSFFFLHITG